LRWSSTRRWPYRDRILDVVWASFSAANLVAIVSYPEWETVPFHFIWVSLTIVYGFRVWSRPATWAVLSVVCLTTGTLIARDIYIGAQPLDEISEVPLMAAMFLAMVWHAHRRLAATQSLERLSQDNVRLLERQRQFVADASHELRTPITIALGHAELLAGALEAGTMTDDAHVVIDELDRLARLADRLLVLAAAEDRDFLNWSEVDIESLIVDVAQRWLLTDRRWSISPPGGAHVIGDSDRLVLAVDALIENAVSSTVPGDTIHLSVTAQDDEVAVTVSDTGKGIAAVDLKRIFDRSIQLEDRQSRRRAGSGLGLSIVQAVATGHGGHVTVTSRLGHGATFTLLLPVADSPSPSRAAAQHPPTGHADAAAL
jgi:signal transduction histidine kinase